MTFFRRTCSKLYDDKWDNDWKDILPKAPEKPSDETGVWRLIDDASDWKVVELFYYWLNQLANKMFSILAEFLNLLISGNKEKMDEQFGVQGMNE